MKKLLATVAVSAATLTVAAPVEARRPDPIDLGDRSFAVVVTILASAIDGLPAGTTFDNCYTFNADGSWIDPQFPDPSTPVAGTWSARSVGPATGYRAAIDAGPAELVQFGLVLESRVHPTKLVARSTMEVAGERVLRVRSVGVEVDDCDSQP